MRMGLGIGLEYVKLIGINAQNISSNVLSLLPPIPASGNASPWVDKSRYANNATLNNFAGTSTSGWVNEWIPCDNGADKAIVNLLGTDGNFGTDSNADGLGDGWAITGTLSAKSISANVQSITPSIQYSGIKYTLSYMVGDVVYHCAYVSTTDNLTRVQIGDSDGSPANNSQHTGSGAYEFLSGRLATIAGMSGLQASIYSAKASAWPAIQIKQVHTLNLTTIFGAGGEPTQAEMDKIVQWAIAKYGYISTRTLKLAKRWMLRLDGTDDYLNLANAASLDLGVAEGEEFAIAATVRFQVDGSSQYVLCKNATTSGDIQYGLMRSSSNQVSLYLNGGAQMALSATAVKINEFHDILFYRDRTGLVTCYLDNDIVQASVLYATLLTTQANVRIGRRETASGYFKGEIADLTVYKGSKLDIRTIRKAQYNIAKNYVPGIAAMKSVWNVASYGATGDGTTDDTAAIQKVLDGAPEGDTVYFPTPSVAYKVTGLTPRKGVNLLGDGATSLITMSGSVANAKVIEYLSNNAGSGYTVSGDLAAGDTVITLNKVTGIIPGDTITFDTSTAAYASSSIYKAGSLRYITAVDTTNKRITLNEGLDYNFVGAGLSSITIRRGYQNVSISNLGIKCQADAQQYGMRLNNIVGLSLHDCTVTGNTVEIAWNATASNNTADNQVGIQLLKCFNGRIHHNTVKGFGRRTDGLGYGIHMAGHDLTAEYNNTGFCKHGILGSEDNYRCNRIKILNNTSVKDYIGYDLHNNVWYSEVSYNTIAELKYHTASALCQVRAPYLSVIGNYAQTADINFQCYGIILDGNPTDHVTIQGNDILAGYYGLQLSTIVAGSVPTNFDISGNTFAADVPIYYGTFDPGLAWGLHDNTLIETR